MLTCCPEIQRMSLMDQQDATREESILPQQLDITICNFYLQIFKTLYVQHLNIKFHTAQSTVQDRVERVQSRNQCDG